MQNTILKVGYLIILFILNNCAELEEDPIFEKGIDHSHNSAQLVQSYIRVFKFTKDGKAILDNLEDISGINKSQYEYGDDTSTMAFREGIKALYLYIKEMSEHQYIIDLHEGQKS